ncbi:hypothetical protein CYMTET_20061 [Cymbomonas tetramitiformis]|uniref:Uncharacterized protein n=1 Tax=Cymbomonas tetramitiformis TaxID=36881 RepID=A0AAE0G4Y0_9CHLO|nr:hypothetical protein CYMTET_20061 [Cymbomonas tetramitiformis]
MPTLPTPPSHGQLHPSTPFPTTPHHLPHPPPAPCSRHPPPLPLNQPRNTTHFWQPINRHPPPTTPHYATAASGSSATAATSPSAPESVASSPYLHFELAEEDPAVLEWLEETERTWAEDLADITALETAEREHTNRKRMLLEGLVHLLFLGLLPLEGGSLATLRAVHPALRQVATPLIRSLCSIESTDPGRTLSFPSTTSLELCSCNLAELDMMELSGLRHLTHLDILGCSDLVGGGLPALALFQHLAFLGLRGQNLHAATPPIGWTSASSLLALDLGQTDVADACANAILRGHPRLVSLDLSSCPRLTGGGLLDGVWPSALSTLSLRDCPLLRDACIVEVTRLKGICSLDTGMCEEVTDEGALAISGMRSLVRLSVEGCFRIRAPGVCFFARLPSLEMLNISRRAGA